MGPGLAGRTAVLFAAVTTLAAGAVAPPATGATPDPRPAHPAEMLRPVAPPPASAATPGPGAATQAWYAADADGIETARTSRPVAPGVRLTSYDRLEPDKWLRVDVLSVDLGAGAARAGHLFSGKVSSRRTVSDLAARHDPGPGRRTAAAVNGDFFDINETGAPQGPGLAAGRVVHSPLEGAHRAVGFGPGAAGRLLRLFFEGTVTLPGGARPLGAYNAANVPAGGIGAYTPGWGEADRALTVDRATPVAEATVRRGRVVSVTERPGSGAIRDGTTVLVGREAGAKALAALRPGDPVSLEYRPRTDSGPVPRSAVGGRELLVVNGKAQDHEGAGNNTAAPRTAVGFSRDGSTMQVVTVDGRQADSGGVTLTELGVLMRRAGAYSALNLDGGGSSTLVARTPGSDALQVENSPSDGSERTVPNGIALTGPDGSGRLRGFRVQPRTPAGAAPTVDPIKGGHPERVFPGLTRQLTATGHDETFGPAHGTPRWRSVRPSVGRVDSFGVFTARSPGTTQVRAERGPAGGGTELTVLDTLRAILPTTRHVGLPDATASGSFGIVGLDAHSTSAPVEPRDVTLEYDRSLFSVTDDGRGSFTVRSLKGGGAGRITVRAAGLTTALAVSVGLEEQPVSGFDDAAAWTSSGSRADGSAAATPEGRTGTGLSLSYGFGRSHAIRAAYVTPPVRIPVPGRPQSFKLWIKGDGKGAWPTLHLEDAAGSDLLLRGPYVTWTGWRQVTFDVPAGAATPLGVHRFYLAETSAAKQYAGRVVLDGLTAQVPPAVALPRQPRTANPLVGTAAKIRGRDWRFAVMSDAQLTARDPGSAAVARARRTLREIRAAKPDFLVVAGDLVAGGSPAGLSFARTLLEQELGDALPWYYVPGSGEVRGGSISSFVAAFGPAHRIFDHRGTRFVTLDTSSTSLRGGGLAQIRALREQLDAAAKDDRVRSVMVIAHVPPRDPAVRGTGRLGDRKEAALLERWLADFRRTTGKGVGFLGGRAGVFGASHVDGVPYLINGSSGGTPAAPPGEGGFTGWSLVGVDKVSARERTAARLRPWAGGPDWVSVQTRAHVDALRVRVSGVPAPGRSARVWAAVVQGGRMVPVRFPLSADWTGSPNLRIGHRGGAGPRHIASFDPGTGTFTALRPGRATLTLTVNGTLHHHPLHIPPPPRTPGPP
ncbi:phosphodiester glycosidase family protein [Streptomyces sp. NPDC058657]|uniref:phosphodiester glycosidase family protein n=1 Tax=unclassified Streptomyces TaxID=2593676 RepID=UPI0036622836